MIIKKTYANGDYAIFKVLDIVYEWGFWWLKGSVIDTNVEEIIQHNTNEWDFNFNDTIEVLER